MLARQVLRERLDALQESTNDLGTLVEYAVDQAAQTLASGDSAVTARLGETNKRIRTRSVALNEQCLLLIATQQPVASDLRLIMATMAIATDLERIGDHARGVTRLTRRMWRDTPSAHLPSALQAMAQQVQVFLHGALDAFRERDVEGARRLLGDDSAIDTAYTILAKELLMSMVAQPETLTRGMNLLKVAHKLERIGDRTSNIGERTIWMRTGAPPGRGE